jgi:hypothetical protein
MARTIDGKEVAATVSVPGEKADLVIQSPGEQAKGGRRKRP